MHRRHRTVRFVVGAPVLLGLVGNQHERAAKATNRVTGGEPPAKQNPPAIAWRKHWAGALIAVCDAAGKEVARVQGVQEVNPFLDWLKRHDRPGPKKEPTTDCTD